MHKKKTHDIPNSRNLTLQISAQWKAQRNRELKQTDFKHFSKKGQKLQYENVQYCSVVVHDHKISLPETSQC